MFECLLLNLFPKFFGIQWLTSHMSAIFSGKNRGYDVVVVVSEESTELDCASTWWWWLMLHFQVWLLFVSQFPWTCEDDTKIATNASKFIGPQMKHQKSLILDGTSCIATRPIAFNYKGLTVIFSFVNPALFFYRPYSVVIADSMIAELHHSIEQQ